MASTQKPKATKNQSRTRQSVSGRKLKQSQYKSFRISKRIKHQRPKLPGAWRLLWRSLRQLTKHWKLFGGITLIYTLLTLVLVRGFGVSSSLPQTKELLLSLFHGRTAQLTSGVTLFSMLLGTNTTSGDAASAYQTMLILVASLALIWALRQSYVATKVKIRDAFYKGMYPLIPFILVIVVIALQLIPLLIANALYSFVFGNGLAVTILEKSLWGVMLFLLALLSLYMVTSSVFALYIVTLPDITPLQALRSARDLVRFRRWTVMRKFVFLPAMFLIIAAIVIIPLLLTATVVAEWVYFALSMLALVELHSYLYALYRELIV